jgi:16S rRNA (uracil1498-N3)-methyltransferase
VERVDRHGIATFFADESLSQGGSVSLGEDVARHVRVLRLGAGSTVQLVDGAGHRARGSIVRLSRDAVTVEIDAVENIAAPPIVHVVVPVADRDRMLWLAEKCAELQATSWRPVLWKRSRSVKPRGEGPVFAGRVRDRMISALEQSRSARLPDLFPEATPERAIAAAPEGTRLVLDAGGVPILDLDLRDPTTIVVGPEGGLEAIEKQVLQHGGFLPASLGPTMLRFETAAIAALAIVRASLLTLSQTANGD